MILYFVFGTMLGAVMGYTIAAILNTTCCDVLEETKPIVENALNMVLADIEDAALHDTVNIDKVKMIFAEYIDRVRDDE